MGGVGRPSARHDVNQLEVREGEDHRKHGDDENDRLEQRQGDVAEAAEAAGAVDRRRLIEFGRDGLQARQEGDGVERQAAPGVDHDEGEHRQVRMAEPTRAGVGDAGVHEHPIDHAEGGIEDPLPGDGR